MLQLGLDLLLYVALAVHFLLRFFVPWQPSRKWLEYLHYFNALFLFLTCLSILEIIWFVGAAAVDFQNRRAQRTSIVLTIFIILTMPALVGILLITWFQSRKHIREIRAGVAAMKHDRALQIIALPPIYGVMAMCALVELYYQVAHGFAEQKRGSAYARYETCILVADLYESWALYQLGRLTFDFLESSLRSSGRTSRFESLQDLVFTFGAVSSLAWLGTWIFVIICVAQAVYSVFLWMIHIPGHEWNIYEAAMQKFSYAGLVASGAAVYNVHILGKVFGNLIKKYLPREKFLSMEAIVFLAFWQLKILLVLKTFHIIPVNSDKIKIFHAALLIYECLACTIANNRAWRVDEEWYALGDESNTVGSEESANAAERKPLLLKGRP